MDPGAKRAGAKRLTDASHLPVSLTANGMLLNKPGPVVFSLLRLHPQMALYSLYSALLLTMALLVVNDVGRE